MAKPKKAKKIAPAVPLKHVIKLTLVKAPQGKEGNSDGATLACLRSLAGGNTVTLHATLNALGIRGSDLAGCLNGTYPGVFKAGDFPGSMEVIQVILFVRSKT